MELAGPITYTPEEITGPVLGGLLVCVAVAALIAGLVGALVGARRGRLVTALRSASWVAVPGVVVALGLTGLARATATPSESPHTMLRPTTVVTPLRSFDHVPYTGDQAVADRILADSRAALAPLATTGTDPTPLEIRAALAPVTTPTGPLEVVTETGRIRGPAFTAEAAGGCLVGSVRGGVATVTIEGYINDGGCVPYEGS